MESNNKNVSKCHKLKQDTRLSSYLHYPNIFDNFRYFGHLIDEFRNRSPRKQS